MKEGQVPFLPNLEQPERLLRIWGTSASSDKAHHVSLYILKEKIKMQLGGRTANQILKPKVKLMNMSWLGYVHVCVGQIRKIFVLSFDLKPQDRHRHENFERWCGEMMIQHLFLSSRARTYVKFLLLDSLSYPRGKSKRAEISKPLDFLGIFHPHKNHHNHQVWYQ